jgi:hypothetical protein
MFWQIYFWPFSVLIVGTAIVRAVLYFSRPGAVSPFEVVESLPGLGVVVALYGYINGLVLGSGFIWAALAVTILIFYVISLRGPKTREVIAKVGVGKAYALLAASFLLTLPGYVGLVRYALQVW